LPCKSSSGTEGAGKGEVKIFGIPGGFGKTIDNSCDWVLT